MFIFMQEIRQDVLFDVIVLAIADKKI